MANVLRSLSNGTIMLALRLGLRVLPYNRANALIVETQGRQSGRVRRTPVGFVADDGRVIVVAEHGDRADYVRNAAANDGRLRIFHDGAWKGATLRLLDDDPELWLRRMDKRHVSFIRRLATQPRVIEITPDES
jgi:deazaflavin-dependent oxidoreductase (nitroreductase family)